MDDGMDEFQEATCDIAGGDYAAAVRRLAKAERKASVSKPAGPVADIVALRRLCEAQLGLGV